MILDRLENSHLYSALHKRIAATFSFLQKTDLAELPLGRHELEGSNLYVMAAKDAVRDVKGAQLEAHRQYIDVQLCLNSVDWIGWRSRLDCSLRASEYDAEKDVELFNDPPDAWVPVRMGYFALFFPEDAHMPLIGDGILHKLVVKIKVD